MKLTESAKSIALTGELKADVKACCHLSCISLHCTKRKTECSHCMNWKTKLAERVKYFKENDKLVEAQRIEQRTNYDMEMLQEIGFCKGIENYSRVLAGREAGQRSVYFAGLFPG